MAFVYGDRVKETSLTNGTITMVLGGPAVGFQSFAIGVGVANECFYGIVNTADDSWEMGRGTVGAGTLSRDTVISSTNSNLLVDFTAGQKVVYTTVPRTFYEAALDAISHGAIDHTVAPLNLLDLAAHQGVDHTAAPFNLLATAQLGAEHELINHLAGPFNLLDIPSHNVIDHTATPFDLLDVPGHESVNHLAAPFELLNKFAHDALDHNDVTMGNNPIPVTPTERTNGASIPPLQLRSFTPEDVTLMVEAHNDGKVAQVVYIEETGVPSFTITVGVNDTPLNDTVPQSSDGGPIFELDITPTNALSTLYIHITATVNYSSASTVAVLLFKDAETAARASFFDAAGSGFHMHACALQYRTAAGSTSTQTWKVRISGDNAGLVTLNGRSGLRIGGGTQRAVLRITEVLP